MPISNREMRSCSLRASITCLCVLSACTVLLASSISSRVVVTFYSAGSRLIIAESLKQNYTGLANATVVKQYGRRLVLDLERTVDISVDAGAIAREIGSDLVESVELDYVVSTTTTSVTDTDGNWFQWNLADSEPHSIKAERVWNMTNSTPDMVVAVLDTGIATVARGAFINLSPGYDFISDLEISIDGDGRDSDPADPGDAGPSCPTPSWHGTKVASILAAGHDPSMGLGMRGVAQNCTVMPIRVLGLCSSGYANDVADAVVYSAGGTIDGLLTNPAPAKVISMSLAGPALACPTYLQSAITQAISLGAIVIAAAGNNGLPNVTGTFPANCIGVISVGAGTRDGPLAAYSNGGATMIAPGGNWADPIATLSVSSLGQLMLSSSVGTSMAAPHVSAAAAILMSARRQTNDSMTVFTFLDAFHSAQSNLSLGNLTQICGVNCYTGVQLDFYNVFVSEVWYYEANVFSAFCQAGAGCGPDVYNAGINRYPCASDLFIPTFTCHSSAPYYAEVGGFDLCGDYLKWGCFCTAGYVKTYPAAYNVPSCDYACPTGTYAPRGSYSCSDCPAGTYNPREHMGACATCPAGNICRGKTISPTPCTTEGNYCPGGSSSEVSCTTCTATQYESAPCTRTSNRQCATITVCNTANQYETQAPSATQDRLCVGCNNACGSTSQYETSTCNGLTNRQCAGCAATCLATQYEKKSCNGVVNRECADCTTCTASQYQTKDCRSGGIVTNNRVCASCTTCGLGKYQSTACQATGPTVNRVCTACPIGKYDDGTRTCVTCANGVAGKYYNTAGVYTSACPTAICANAVAGQYYPGPTGIVAACVVSKCSNALPSQYYTSLGGVSAPTTAACPINTCTNAKPYQYYNGTGGNTSGTTATSCPVKDCTNVPSFSQYYSAAGLIPTGCQLSNCTNKPENSQYLPSSINLNSSCPWICNMGYMRNSSSCMPCPMETYRSSSLSTDAYCDTCTPGVSMPSLFAIVRNTTANTACDWECVPPPAFAFLNPSAISECDWSCKSSYKVSDYGTECVPAVAAVQTTSTTTAAVTTSTTTTAAPTTSITTTPAPTTSTTTTPAPTTSTTTTPAPTTSTTTTAAPTTSTTTTAAATTTMPTPTTSTTTTAAATTTMPAPTTSTTTMAALTTSTAAPTTTVVTSTTTRTPTTTTAVVTSSTTTTRTPTTTTTVVTSSTTTTSNPTTTSTTTTPALITIPATTTPLAPIQYPTVSFQLRVAIPAGTGTPSLAAQYASIIAALIPGIVTRSITASFQVQPARRRRRLFAITEEILIFTMELYIQADTPTVIVILTSSGFQESLSLASQTANLPSAELIISAITVSTGAQGYSTSTLDPTTATPTTATTTSTFIGPPPQQISIEPDTSGSQTHHSKPCLWLSTLMIILLTACAS